MSTLHQQQQHNTTTIGTALTTSSFAKNLLYSIGRTFNVWGRYLEKSAIRNKTSRSSLLLEKGDESSARLAARDQVAIALAQVGK